MSYPTLQLTLPPWIHDVVGDPRGRWRTEDERMALAIALAQRNAEEGGGPFGAAVFEIESGRLVAPGVNLVVPARCSAAHAEVVALSIAQQVRDSFDLRAGDGPGHELVTSTEPCAQCFGAILWAGIDRLTCGARGEDAEAIGFDEGPKPERWIDELTERGTEVVRDVLREEAANVLRGYHRQGGPIYNPGD